jgi:hypothetical protein
VWPIMRLEATVFCLKEAVVGPHPKMYTTLVNCSQCGKLQIHSIFFTNLSSRLDSDPFTDTVLSIGFVNAKPTESR